MANWFFKKRSIERGSSGSIIRRRRAHLRRLRRKSGETDVSESSTSGMDGILVFLCVLFVVTTGYVFVWSPYVQVEDVRVEDVSKDLSQRVSRVIDGYLSGYRYRFVPSGSFLFIRTEDMEEDISRQFPEIRSVEISKRFPDHMDVRIVTRERVLILCSGGPCFVVDESGMVRGGDFLINPEFPRVILVDTSGAPVDFTDPVLPSETVAFVLDIGTGLRERVDIGAREEYSLPSRLARTVDVVTDDGWRLSINTEIPAHRTFENLRLFLDRQVPARDRTRLEYVDMRTENRIFYRFVGDGDQSVQDSGDSDEQKSLEKKDRKELKKT